MGTTDTLGSDAYKTLLSSYQGNVSRNVEGDAFNAWTDGIMRKLGVGTWEELPRDWESRQTQPPAFTNALNDFTSLLQSGGDETKSPSTEPTNSSLQATTPPDDNAAILGTTGNQPTQSTNLATGVTDLLASLVQDKPSQTIYTISPTSVTTTAATYNVNQNPSDVLTPVLQAQSSFFSGLMKSFDVLVSKITLERRTEVNASNGALTAALNEQRTPYGGLLWDQAKPNSPGGVAAVVEGFPGSEGGGGSKSSSIPWGSISVAIGLVSLGLFFLFRRK